MARWIYVGPKLSTGEPERSLALSGISAANADGDIDDEGLNDEQMEALRRSEFWRSEAHLQAAETRKQNAAAKEKAAKKPATKKAAMAPANIDPNAEPLPPGEIADPAAYEAAKAAGTIQEIDRTRVEPMPADSGETE